MRPQAGFLRSSPRSLLTFLTAALVLATAVPAAAQWSTQSPLPTYLDVRGVGAPTANRVFVATADNSFDDGGALWESTDGGATWTQLPIPISLGAPLNGLIFQDALTGWTFGNDQYVTTDGGDTWSQLPLLGSIYYMDFPTAGFGWAYGGGAFTYTTLDGGANWTQTPNGERWFDFADSLNGLAVADTGLFRSTDGGVTFGQVFTGFGHAVEYLSPSVAVGIVDTVFVRSTDGGATWTPGVLTEGRSDLFVVSPSIALASGRSGPFGAYDDRVFRTTDAGLTWTDLGEVLPDGVWGFGSPAPSVVIGAALNGDMYRSTDDGLSWTQTYASPGPFPGFLSSARPAFADASTGYFGYGAGFVIRTTDGGASWAQVSSGTGNSLNAMARFPNGDLIAVGDNGTLLTSSGGGTPWTWQPAFTSNDLTAIEVLNATDVVAGDEAGFLHRSSDAGATWVTGASSSSVDGEEVDFTTLLDGWMIGFSSTGDALYRTTDGGDTWTGVPDFAGAYKAVDFEGTNGWAANVG
ncbi:MAG TPA: hypothetical protein VKU85_09470, partial [bacterium]|nr:hypothetical protein [bacterium]